MENEDLVIKNMTAVLKVPKRINLDKLTSEIKDTGIEYQDIDYNPENFPGAVLKVGMGDNNVTFLIFARNRKGKGRGTSIVITGCKSVEALYKSAAIGRIVATKFADENGNVGTTKTEDEPEEEKEV